MWNFSFEDVIRHIVPFAKSTSNIRHRGNCCTQSPHCPRSSDTIWSEALDGFANVPLSTIPSAVMTARCLSARADIDADKIGATSKGTGRHTLRLCPRAQRPTEAGQTRAQESCSDLGTEIRSVTTSFSRSSPDNRSSCCTTVGKGEMTGRILFWNELVIQ